MLRQLSLQPGWSTRTARRRGAGKIDPLIETARGGRRGSPGAGVQPVHQVPGQSGQRLDGSRVEYLLPDGPRPRPRARTAFKDGTAPVFLISLKAGGFGLNLTEADYCFLLDPWWNPAAEHQAVDRAHRIGQQHTVLVYRLVSHGHDRGEGDGAEARGKAALFTGVLDDGDLFSGSLSAADIRGLLGDAR